MKVLIIDDHDSIRDLLAMWCRATGRRALVAAGGAEGLALLAEKGADAVLVDVDMPGLRGPEVCRRIRAQSPDVPVVLMSGRCPRELAGLAEACGASGALGKPFDLTLLDGLLRGLVPA